FDVFDRWGNLLFTRSDFPPNQYQLGWDGTANGKRLIPGIYVYTARVEFIDQVEDTISGEILVIE
ncbi:MAG TPA: gliding motility-associated C-terminal domain-containing protein, partial [Membranihabitans sp.]|nr:gliding motility-associated C-terminal domain-containing protein [Membranihabitans sp.]